MINGEVGTNGLTDPAEDVAIWIGVWFCRETN